MSDCKSVERDEALVELMNKTPRTPIKMATGKSRLSSGRCRGLFEANRSISPNEGLGLMSPLSSSEESIDSPSFSPNGRFLTPSPRKDRDIHIHSSLFPAVKSFTPSRRSSRNKENIASPNMRKSMSVLQGIIGEEENELCSQVSTPRSSRRAGTSIVAETIISPNSVVTSRKSQKFGIMIKRPNQSRTLVIPASPTRSIVSSLPRSTGTENKKPKQIIAPVSNDLFYGPPKAAPVAKKQVIAPLTEEQFYGPPKPHKSFMIDTRSAQDWRRAKGFESFGINANRGAQKRQRSTSRGSSRASKKKKDVIPGVWHTLRKPKKALNKPRIPKPVMSPNTRLVKQVNKMISSDLNAKSLFDDKSRKRIAEETSSISKGATAQPSKKQKYVPQIKDPNNKFFKYHSRPFKVSIVPLVKIQGDDEGMRLMKRKVRKLYTPPDSFDFNDVEDNNKETNDAISEILKTLEDTPAPQSPALVKKISDKELMNILDSPGTTINVIPAAPGQVLTEVTDLGSSPQRCLSSHMSNLAIAESGRLHLGETGSILTSTSNLLNDSQEFTLNDENAATVEYFPIFDKSNWNFSYPDADGCKDKEKRRKGPLVPDDQYLLDAGQKSVGIIICQQCDFMYQAGHQDDEAKHKIFHHNLLTLAFPGWKHERVIGRYEDGRVIVVTANDMKPHVSKAENIVRVVDEEIGFFVEKLKWKPDMKVLIYINEKKKAVAGCLVSEKVQLCCRVIPSSPDSIMEVCDDSNPIPCKVGVSRIWTSKSFRRRGVASKMLQCLRRISGDIAADDVAFTSPTMDGKELIKKLVGRPDFKVYGVSEVL